MNYSKSLLTALLAPLIAFGGGAVTTAHAAGYAVFTQGASALGQGNAVTAHSDDPSTIFYNPALINKLEGTQFQIGTTAILSSREYQSNQPGGTSTSNDSAFFPSTFYATHKFNDKVSAGLGVFNPFGLGTEWNDDWDGRYIATESKLKTFNINPVVSYRVIPSLAIAAGVDVVLLDATLERKIPFTLPPPNPPITFDVHNKFKGDGTGVGFNVAVAYDICDHLSLGASYRSKVKIDVSGDATFSNATLSGMGVPVAANNSSGKADITLPPQFTAGAAFKPSDKITLEAGMRWEGWSKFKELAIELDNGNTSVTPRNWKDSWGLNLGGRYQLNDTAALLAGYVFGNSAVPDSTFDPSIPDAKTHVFCAGTDLNLRPFKVAVSYGYQLYENRTRSNSVNSPLADGKYKSDAHLVALALGYQF